MKVESKTLAVVGNQSQQEERIKISDGNGNTGYLSSNKQDLIQGNCGLEDLKKSWKEEH